MPFPLLRALCRAPSLPVEARLALESVPELAARVAELERDLTETRTELVQLRSEWDQYEERLARIAERYRRERARITAERLREAEESPDLPSGLPSGAIGAQNRSSGDPRQLEFPVEHMSKDQLRRLARERAMQRVPQASGE